MAEAALAMATLASAYAMTRRGKQDKSPSSFSTVPKAQAPIDKSRTRQDLNTYAQPANQTTDRFFQGDCSTSTSGATFVSLTGETVNDADFTHNNCVPFFGARMKGSAPSQNNGSAILDNMAGTGYQQKRKKEIAPLFAPQKNMSWSHGMPNSTDFFKERQVPSNRMANIKPWVEERVAPGLGKDPNALGGGYNTALQDRDAWLPKTVSQLRVLTNPKETFGLKGHEGPAASEIKASASTSTQGAVNKNRPDTSYALGPSRWFTTKGVESGQTHRSEIILQPQDRGLCNTNYFGGSTSEGKATYINSFVNRSHKRVLEPAPLGPCNTHAQIAGDRVSSYENKCNNRATTDKRVNMGPIKAAVEAIVNPIFDVIRHTRKSNVVGTGRLLGNAQTAVGHVPYSNSQNRAKTTLKEQTVGLLGTSHLNYQAMPTVSTNMSSSLPKMQNRSCVKQAEPGIAGPASTGSTFAKYDNEARLPNTRRNTQSRFAGMLGNLKVGGPAEKTKIRLADKGNYVHDQSVSTKARANPASDMVQRWAPLKGATVRAPSTPNTVMTKVRDYDRWSCKAGNERIDPHLLSAFKANPYTHSLSSY